MYMYLHFHLARVLEVCKVGVMFGQRPAAASNADDRGTDTCSVRDSLDINSPPDSRLPTLSEARTERRYTLSDKPDSKNGQLASLPLLLPRIKRRTYPGCEKNQSLLVSNKRDHGSFATSSCTPSDLPNLSESRMNRQCTLSERTDQPECKRGRLDPLKSPSHIKTYPGCSKSARDFAYDGNSLSMQGKGLSCAQGYLPSGVRAGFNVAAKSKIQELMVRHPTDYSQSRSAVRGMLEAYGRKDEKKSEAVAYEWSDIFRVSQGHFESSLAHFDKHHEAHPVSRRLPRLPPHNVDKRGVKVSGIHETHGSSVADEALRNHHNDRVLTKRPRVTCTNLLPRSVREVLAGIEEDKRLARGSHDNDNSGLAVRLPKITNNLRFAQVC